MKGHFSIARLLPAVQALILLLAGAAQAKDADLVFDPKKMKSLNYEIEFQMEQRFGPFAMEINQSGAAVIQFLEATEEGSKFSVKFTKLEGTMKMGDELKEQDLGIVGKEIWVMVNANGKVEDIEPQATMDDQTRELSKDLVSQMFAYLPNKRIKEGGTWIQDLDEEPEGDEEQIRVEGDVEYTLEGFKKEDGRELAEVVGEGGAKITGATPMGEIDAEAKGFWEGKVAVQGGYVVHAKGTMEFGGKMGEQDIDRVQRIECRLVSSR